MSLSGRKSPLSLVPMSAGPTSSLRSAPTMDEWPIAPSRTIILVRTTQITKPMRQRPNSRTPVIMERSADGTLKNMYGCTKTNTQFSKAWSSMGTLVLMSGPKSGTCWTASRPMSLILQRGRSGLPLPYKTTLMTALPCSKTSSATSGQPPPVLPPLRQSGLNGSETMVREWILSPTCLWMIVTTLVRSMPCCLRPRSSA